MKYYDCTANVWLIDHSGHTFEGFGFEGFGSIGAEAFAASLS